MDGLLVWGLVPYGQHLPESRTTYRTRLFSFFIFFLFFLFCYFAPHWAAVTFEALDTNRKRTTLP